MARRRRSSNARCRCGTGAVAPAGGTARPPGRATDSFESFSVRERWVEEFAFCVEKQALVVAYHELMWDVMDRFEAEDLVWKPVAFAETDRTEPSDIADLVFIVRGSKRDF